METINPTQPERIFADAKALAERYGVSVRTIARWMSAGLLVGIKIRRVVRFDIPACDVALRQHGIVSRL
jgi:hypothetical protein